LSGRLKAIGWSFLFLAGGFVLALLVVAAFRSLFHPQGGATTLAAAAIEAGALVAGYGLLSWIIGGAGLRLTLRDFGLVPLAPGVAGFGRGTLAGGALAATAMVIAVPLGHAAWRNDGGTPGAWLVRVLVTAGVLLPAALGEELAFRGVPLLALSRGFGRLPALVVLALLFGLAHLNNPGVTGLAVANIALAGIFLGFAFFTPGGLWASTGVHFGWNLALAALAAPVSGLGLPMPWLDYAPGEPGWLTGGGFGPEGGVVATLCLVTGCYFARRRMHPAAGLSKEAAA
jgi:hypothetical protein